MVERLGGGGGGGSEGECDVLGNTCPVTTTALGK